MKRALIVGLGLAVAISACGKSKEQQQAEQAAQAAQNAAGEAAKGFEQMAKGLEAMAGGAKSDQKPVDPVSFRDMIALMPDLDGWEKAKPTGERMSTPFAYSTAEVAYTKGDSRIGLKMTDSGFNQLLLMPYAMFLSAGYEKDTPDGYEKSTQVNGQPGWETWDSSSKNGELNALVGKRFLVQIEGSQVGDTRALHDLANKIDMGKLASLK